MKMKKKGNENEVKMTMRWKLLNQDAKRGTQKKREGENTNTWNLAQNGQPWKDKGKRKTEADGKRKKTSGGGGRQKRLNQPDTAQTYNNLSTQRAKPTWREENARTHEKGRKGTHGELVNDMMHPQRMQFPLIRLNGLSSSHNPLDSLSRQPLNYVHNSTSPTTIKERSTIPARMSCYLECHVNGCGRSLEATGKGVVVAASYADRTLGNGEGQSQRPTVSTQNDIDRWNQEKWPAVHFT